MESAKARNLANFHVHMLVETAKSRARLESWECFTHNQVIAFRGLVVGIGFSDLRCALGESVEGLFLQDAFDDEHPGVLFESGAGPLHHLKTSKGVSDAQ
ncbi:MAG: hypothetical protein KDA42_00115 [Planctomycetales bacterium]|nr:hypothetical protein [Planctomycetales bacterium]